MKKKKKSLLSETRNLFDKLSTNQEPDTVLSSGETMVNRTDVILALLLDKIKANYYRNIISLCLLLSPNNSSV